jgi:hypothetical protein
VATISVKDTWFTDPRRGRLIRLLKCDPRLVDGIMLEYWRTGQEFEVKGDLPSIHIFDSSELQAIASVGLAELRGEYVYILGSKEAAAYRLKNRESGRVGGLKSAEARRSDSNDLTQAKPKRDPSESNLSPSPSPLPSHSLKPNTRGDKFFSLVSEQTMKAIWRESYPRKDGWTRGWAELRKQCLAPDTDPQAFREAVVRFSREMKRQERPYDKILGFPNFCLEWRDWVEFEPPQEDAAPSPASADRWLEKAQLVARALAHSGNWSGKDRAEVEQILGGPGLMALAIAAGTNRMRQLQAGPFYLKTIAGMLKEAAENARKRVAIDLASCDLGDSGGGGE